MIDAGKAYNAANKQFVSGIRELAQQSTTDEVIEVNENMTSLKTVSLNHYAVYICWDCAGCLFTFIFNGVSTQTKFNTQGPLKPHIIHFFVIFFFFFLQ